MRTIISTTIMIRINIFNCITLILGQLIFLTTTEAYHEILTVNVQAGEEIIALRWKRTNQYLANENLPIWNVWQDTPPSLIPDVMEQVGDFEMFHDTKHSSAVVYFANSNSLYGVIDTRFYINGLPLNQLGTKIYHKVGGQYVKKRDASDNSEYFHDFLVELTHKEFDDNMINMNVPVLPRTSQHCQSKPLDLSINHNSHDETHKNLYPEILVFVSNEIIEKLERDHPDNCLSILVSQYIIYFNAIDMLFKQLTKNTNINIHLNIAGIVMEEQHGIFPYKYIEGASDKIDISKTVADFPQFIQKYNDIFVQDSFDMFFLSTKVELVLNGLMLAGASRSKVAVYQERARLRSYEKLGSIVQQKNAAGDYVVAAHELFHLMGGTHDMQNANCKSVDSVQCSFIMQRISSYCKNCLKWSDKSMKEIKRFVSTNRNHCYLLNKPRSLYKFGTPVKSLDPLQQCLCYGYTSFSSIDGIEENVGLNGCHQRLNCFIENHINIFPIPLPIDGTPCSNTQVCWRGHCTKLRKPKLENSI